MKNEHVMSESKCFEIEKTICEKTDAGVFYTYVDDKGIIYSGKCVSV